MYIDVYDALIKLFWVHTYIIGFLFFGILILKCLGCISRWTDNRFMKCTKEGSLRKESASR